jgi:hypothetical protein
MQVRSPRLKLVYSSLNRVLEILVDVTLDEVERWGQDGRPSPTRLSPHLSPGTL